jgi:exonuclease SbcC
MRLKKITLNNIRSYEYQEIEFPEGSILLSGDIGSGKTSILLGIEFALFGLQPGQRGSALLRNGEKEGKVIIEFDIDDKEIIVERTLKRGKTISQDYCSIIINGEKKELSVTELKNKILELLDYPKEFSKKQNILYKFTVYTPQEEMKQIILQDPETRINTLRHVFGIDKYKKILENSSIIILKIREEKRLKQGLTENFEEDKANIILKENELETKCHNFISVEKELFLKTENRKKIQEEKDNISKKIEEKNKIQQEIEKTKIMFLNKNESILDNIKIIEHLNIQIKELQDLEFDESKIIQLEEEIELNKKQRQKFNEENLEINSQITSINYKNEENIRLEKNISNLEICPTCLQDVDAIYRTNVLNKSHSDIAENNRKLETLEQERKQLSEKIKIIDSKIYLKEKEITDLKIFKIKLQGIQEKQIRLEEIKKLNTLLEKDIELLNRHTTTLKDSVFELNRFDNIFELKQKELEESLNEERLAEIKVAELKKEIDMFSMQIQESKEKIKKTEKIKEQLNYLIELENWLFKKFVPLISFIEKNVMIKLKAEFSNLFAKWFSILVSDLFDVRLSDDFSPIIGQQDYDIDYAYLSGGERTAIALAYRLSLNQVINSFLSKIKTIDLVILDEPTDGFSDQQLDKMRDILQELNIKQLIIVSHEQKIESFVENVMRFKKEGGISVVEK